ncbi:MAG: stage 0 sporulation family protein [Clostridia bacterium]|nr:stage 0 sporulation family protein [Clostridia bacterium]MBQ3090897.1 stage 0 sporulation family protein [Clostridia bacterium]MBQ9925783.1 stage 0 sporulation family protein [Clostridia bacterium]
MTEIIGVRFKKVGKIYYFDPVGQEIPMGKRVIVETARGIECGETVIPNREVEDGLISQPLKKLIRIATEEDLEVLRTNERLEKEAFAVCEQKIRKHELAMKLVAVEYTFDHSKILFYFSADGRVDFRDLVKDLASVFRTRIELRQIGVRDAAKMVGGLGICGCPLCCSTFLDDFQPVSINMAKDQGLSLNPTKISGTCGRLMCCLKYENEVYQELIKTSPTTDSLVDTPKGKGTVLDVSLLKGCCRVRLQNNPDSPEVFPCEDCKVLRRGKGGQNQNLGEKIDKKALNKLKD